MKLSSGVWISRGPLLFVLMALPTALPAQRDTVEVPIARVGGAEAGSSDRLPVRELALTGTSPENPFGSLAAVATLPGGGVVVYDDSPANDLHLAILSREGSVVARFGRSGAGPGEVGSLGALMAASDGGVWVLDRRNRRVIKFDGRGRTVGSVATPRPGGPYPNLAIHSDPRSVWVRTVLGPPREGYGGFSDPQASGFIRVSLDGTASDTLKSRADLILRPARDQFAPHEMSVPVLDGGLLRARADRLGFLIEPRSNAAPIRRINLSYVPVNVLPDERREFEAVLAWQQRVTGGDLPPRAVRPNKPALRFVEVTPTGQVWLWRHTTARRLPEPINPPGPAEMPKQHYAEPPVATVIGLDGTLFGTFRFPLGSRGHSVWGSVAWGIQAGPDGADQLVRWALVP